MRYEFPCCAVCILLLVISGCGEQVSSDSDSPSGGKANGSTNSENSSGALDGKVDVPEPGEDKIAMGARLFVDKDDPSRGKVAVRVRLAEGWHLYAVLGPDAVETQAKFTLNETPNVTPDGDWIVPVALPDKEDPLMQLWEGDLLFTQKVKLGELDPDAKLSVNLSYQICNEQGCMPPTDVEIPVER